MLYMKYTHLLKILFKIEEYSIKFTGFIGITVELTVKYCRSIYRKILAILPTKYCKTYSIL